MKRNVYCNEEINKIYKHLDGTILQTAEAAVCRHSSKIGVLKYSAIFTGKYLCWSLFLTKLETFMPETVLKRDSNTIAFL